MVDKALTQPIKQAFREVYIITDAEKETKTFSNRFAAHNLIQRQFATIAKNGGWEYEMAGPSGNWAIGSDASKFFPELGMCLTFEIKPNEAYGDDLYYSVVTSGRWTASKINNDMPGADIALEKVKPIIFSEFCRNIDLFTSVCSIGIQPDWVELHEETGGVWNQEAFSELSKISKNRKACLERLIPRLSIASKCRFDDRFLVVEGKIRTYKIHLGSGNILMLPNDQYLCIVDAGNSSKDDIYLPFEGDYLLSNIISKALLLAADEKIEDPVIMKQINSE